jgi:hypothetical protein
MDRGYIMSEIETFLWVTDFSFNLFVRLIDKMKLFQFICLCQDSYGGLKREDEELPSNKVHATSPDMKTFFLDMRVLKPKGDSREWQNYTNDISGAIKTCTVVRPNLYATTIAVLESEWVIPGSYMRA